MDQLFPIKEFSGVALGSGYFHPKRNDYNDVVYSIVPERDEKRAFSFEILQKYFEKTPEETKNSFRLQ